MPDRIIKESICTSDTLNCLSDFEERFWHRLIVNCDDYGRFDARPAILKGRLFPLSEGRTLKDMQNALSKLASVGLVELYQVGGRPFLRVVTWDKYQRIRAKRSKYPEPEGPCRQMTAGDGNGVRNPIQSQSNPDPNPKEGDARAAALAAVMSAYMDRINPKPSPSSLEELKGYVEAMGGEVCLKAIDTAVDAGKGTWSYVRAILRAKREQGVKSLADWNALEQRRSGGKQALWKPGQDRNAPDPRAKEHTEEMRRMLERMKEEA